ncbi:MAG: MBL fold metallo-hydrolase [Oscillospiraceae bacterium]|nr:MBL fold metallo-hydrolase [Oscillospiraceae bacterium]
MTDNIEVFTHSSIRIKGNGKTVYIDPFKMDESPSDADVIFITHDHFDHFSPDDIAKVITDDTVIVVPANMADKAKGYKNVVTVDPGDKTETEGIPVEAVPAYNPGKPFHPKSAGWVGYILTIEGRRIYIMGDSDITPEAEKVKCDIALVPIGGKYTMDAKQAADLINTISPQYVIPTHYGNIVGTPEDGKVFASNVKPPVKVTEKIKF